VARVIEYSDRIIIEHDAARRPSNAHEVDPAAGNIGQRSEVRRCVLKRRIWRRSPMPSGSIWTVDANADAMVAFTQIMHLTHINTRDASLVLKGNAWS
jgi:hypothetical protein